MNSDKGISCDLVRKLKETNHFADLNLYGKDTLKLILKKLNGMVWSPFIWLRIGTTGQLL
jgi:hypothetical protein